MKRDLSWVLRVRMHGGKDVWWWWEDRLLGFENDERF